ncbi:Carbon-nitrogen hydrolase, partial [Ascosphaera acerosa]
RLSAAAAFLPEASDYIASSAEETISLVRSVQDSPFVLGLQQEARRCGLPISVGVHEPATTTAAVATAPAQAQAQAQAREAPPESAKKVKNTLIWIDERGDITQRYQKIHLFDVSIEGAPVLQESRSVEKGTSILPPFASPVGKIGLGICFDTTQLRFPELSLALRRQGAQVITYPSAFTVPTGRAHWEVLLRSRAIETQSYVVAAAQAGRHNGSRVSYGRSMIVDPWGTVLAALPGVGAEGKLPVEAAAAAAIAPAIATAEIDLAYLERVRVQVPLARRTDVYPEV